MKVNHKLLSARFWLSLMFGSTACVGFLLGILPTEAFMTLASASITAYVLKTRIHENPLNASNRT